MKFDLLLRSVNNILFLIKKREGGGGGGEMFNDKLKLICRNSILRHCAPHLRDFGIFTFSWGDSHRGFQGITDPETSRFSISDVEPRMFGETTRPSNEQTRHTVHSADPWMGDKLKSTVTGCSSSSTTIRYTSNELYAIRVHHTLYIVMQHIYIYIYTRRI